MTNAVTKDAEAVAKALIEIERLISRYEAPGPRDTRGEVAFWTGQAINRPAGPPLPLRKIPRPYP